MKNSVSKWFFKLKLEKSQWKGTSKICMVIKFVIERFKKKKKNQIPLHQINILIIFISR